jgi:hypothetical protein
LPLGRVPHASRNPDHHIPPLPCMP